MLYYVDDESLTGASGWSTCHTRASSRPAVRSGIGTERFETGEDKEVKGKWVAEESRAGSGG